MLDGIQPQINEWAIHEASDHNCIWFALTSSVRTRSVEVSKKAVEEIVRASGDFIPPYRLSRCDVLAGLFQPWPSRAWCIERIILLGPIPIVYLYSRKKLSLLGCRQAFVNSIIGNQIIWCYRHSFIRPPFYRLNKTRHIMICGESFGTLLAVSAKSQREGQVLFKVAQKNKSLFSSVKRRRGFLFCSRKCQSKCSNLSDNAWLILLALMESLLHERFRRYGRKISACNKLSNSSFIVSKWA